MQADDLDSQGLDEQSIIDYLRGEPDFFVRHKALLTELNLPHASGRAVSLVEHQVAIMRERNVDMRRRMNELLDAARVNDALFSKTRSLTLALLDAESLQALNEVLATYVLVDFEADFVCAHVQGVNHTLDHIQNHPGELPFAHLFNGTSAVCTTLREAELKLLFPVSNLSPLSNLFPESNLLPESNLPPESNYGDSGSVVILRLDLEDGAGALCIGSRDAHRFSSDMDTLFVTYIADVLSKVLKRL